MPPLIAHFSSVSVSLVSKALKSSATLPWWPWEPSSVATKIVVCPFFTAYAPVCSHRFAALPADVRPTSGAAQDLASPHRKVSTCICTHNEACRVHPPSSRGCRTQRTRPCPFYRRCTLPINSSPLGLSLCPTAQHPWKPRARTSLPPRQPHRGLEGPDLSSFPWPLSGACRSLYADT